MESIFCRYADAYPVFLVKLVVGEFALALLDGRVGNFVRGNGQRDVYAGVLHGLGLDLQHAIQQCRVLPLDGGLHDYANPSSTFVVLVLSLGEREARLPWSRDSQPGLGFLQVAQMVFIRLNLAKPYRTFMCVPMILLESFRFHIWFSIQ